MLIRKIRDLKLSAKILGIVIFSVLLFALIIWLYILPIVAQNIIEEKRTAIKSSVEVAYCVITNFYNNYTAGSFTLKDAQTYSSEAINQLRYGNNEYFWINDINCKMIMHPFKPELNGQDVSTQKDPNGKFIFVEMVNICKNKGEGFVDYMWPKPGVTEPVPKISYVKYFKPWNWVIGNGIYVEDIETTIAEIKYYILIGLASTIIVAMIVGMLFAKYLSRPIKRLIELFGNVSNGDLRNKMVIDSSDEIGELSIHLNRLIDIQRQQVSDIISNVKLLNNSSESLLQATQQINSAISELLAQANTAASSSEEISTNINAISSAAEQLSNSVMEISKNTHASAQITHEASDKASAASQVVTKLGTSSIDIGNIIKVITDIAGQTNLLALNATIEAARAGETGKSFAVVAGEVKELAKETAKASDSIVSEIQNIQQDSQNAIEAINEILSITGKINDISNSVASAIEQQTTTTGEINRNLSEATKGVNIIAEINSGVAYSTEEFVKMSNSIKTASKNLFEIANSLENKLISSYRLE